MSLVRLAPSEFGRVLPLIPHGVGHVSFSHAVIEERMPGQVWVDDTSSPATAVVMSDADFCLAFGEPRGDLVRESLREILAANHSEKPELWATTDAWAEALGFLGPPASRNEFHFDGLPDSVARLPIPSRYRLASLDAGLAATFGQAGVDPWVVRIWGGPERFATEAFGWAVLDDSGRLASFCTTCSIGGGEAEIEIGTADLHRRRGLAAVAGAKFISDCLERGLVPAWTCAAGNAGSNRLAEILGFRYARTISGYPLERP